MRSALALERAAPDRAAVAAVVELDVDADALWRRLHASLQHVAHADLAADHAGVGVVAFARAGAARHHRQLVVAGQLGHDLAGQPLAEVALLRVAAGVGERQHGDLEASHGGLRADRFRAAAAAVALACHPDTGDHQ